MSTENHNEPENEIPTETVLEPSSAYESTDGTPTGDNTMAMLCHLISFVGFLGIPLGNILGPLVIWLIKKDQDALVDETGKEVINFQISVLIYGLVCGLLVFAFGIGIILMLILLVAVIIFTIIGAMKANEGQLYRYPYTIRLIK